MTDAKPKFFVTYEGKDVVKLQGVGVFQHGTRACCDESTARAASAMPHFVVSGPGYDDRVIEEVTAVPVVADAPPVSVVKIAPVAQAAIASLKRRAKR